MPLVYAGVVPHAPLLLPTIAKEHEQLLATTRQALAQMAQELHARQADVVIILTPHGSVIPGTISVNVADKYRGRLTEFGDVRTEVMIPGAPAVAQKLKAGAERADIPIALQSAGQLDYGTTVPMFFLRPADNQLRIITVNVGGQSVATLLRFGAMLHEFFHADPARYALIASADLERRSKKKSATPGVSSQADQRPTAMEKQIAVAITKVEPSVMAGITPPKHVCGWHPILTLLASLQPTSASGRTTSFAAPFGVGQMTATIDLPS